MTILTNVWRFQCDPNGSDDPIVEVFLKKTVTVDGETFEKQESTPVLIKFSELTGGISDLINVEKVSTIQTVRLGATISVAPTTSTQ